MITVRVTCRDCGTANLEASDLFVLASSGMAIFTHCGIDHEVVLRPLDRLALAVAGCMEADAADIEAHLWANTKGD